MRLLGIVVTKPNHITSSTVSKHVSNLLVSIGCVFSSFDSSIGSLQRLFLDSVKNSKFGSTPKQMKAKLEAYLLDPHCER